MAYRSNLKHHGDYEQVYSPFWRVFDYWDLYVLGTMDSGGKATRKVYLVYNKNDPCCFMDPAASHFQNIVNDLKFDQIEVIVDANNEHSIDVDLATRMLFDRTR